MVSANPFKFLNPLEKGDLNSKEFGRQSELIKAHELLKAFPVLLIFGEAGVGKTSFIRCGLANKFIEEEWSDILVLRKGNINESLSSALQKTLNENFKFDNDKPICELVQEIYYKNFKPIYLIFDQLEELFVNGSIEEIEEFYKSLSEIISRKSTICKCIFSIREDFLSHLHYFDLNIEEVYSRSLSLKRLTIDDSVIITNVILENHKEKLEIIDCSINQLGLNICSAVSENGTVHLPILQTFLFIMWEKAEKELGKAQFNLFLIEKLKGKDLLQEYLINTIEELNELLGQSPGNKSKIWHLLSKFISGNSSKKACTINDFGNINFPNVPNHNLNVTQYIVDYLIKKEIIIEIGDKNFSLIHDSIIPKIVPFIPLSKKEKLKIPLITGNPFGGLKAYTEDLNDRFFGRKRITAKYLEFLESKKCLVLVGESGTGKSSIVMAGIVPRFREYGYEISLNRAGDDLKKLIKTIEKNLKSFDKLLVYVDQFEELVTRKDEQEETKLFIGFLNAKLNSNEYPNFKLIITVRSDYEPEFDSNFSNWRMYKNIVEKLDVNDIREIIVEPAYLAGFEYEPDYLVDILIDEVKNSVAILPLLSYTLSQMYDSYIDSENGDFILREEFYLKIGGVIEGLKNRADEVYNGLIKDGYSPFIIRNIFLRLITGPRERTGRRAFQDELYFDDIDNNKNEVKEILERFIGEKLIITGSVLIDKKNNQWKKFYEPAHDFLIRNWQQIELWVNSNVGIDYFYLKQGLSQAIKDYNNVKEEGKGNLWDNDHRILTIERYRKEDNWLNQYEKEFVKKSIKNKGLKTNLKRLFRTILIMSFFCLVYLSILISEKNKLLERETFDLIRQKGKVDILNSKLISIGQKDSILIDSIKRQEKNILAQIKLNEEQIKLTNQANERLSKINKELDRSLYQKDSIINLNELITAAKILRDKSNIFLGEAKSNQVPNPAISFQLAKFAYSKDSTFTELIKFYSSLKSKNSFYESEIIENVDAAQYSSKGDFLLLFFNDNSMQIFNNYGILLDSLRIEKKVSSVNFMTNSENLIFMYDNYFEIYSPISKKKIASKSLQLNEKILSTYNSLKGEHIYVFTEKEILVYNSFNLERQDSIKYPYGTENLQINNNIVFSNKDDVVYYFDIESKKAGEFIESNLKSFLLQNGHGAIYLENNNIFLKKIDGNILKFQNQTISSNYKIIKSVSISDDNKKILVLVDQEVKQQIIQQQQQLQLKTKNIPQENSNSIISPILLLLDLNTNGIKTIEFFGNTLVPEKAEISNDGNYIMTAEHGFVRIFDVKQQSLLYEFGGYTNYKLWDFNPIDPNVVMTISGNPITKVNNFKLWKKGTPEELDLNNQLFKIDSLKLK